MHIEKDFKDSIDWIYRSILTPKNGQLLLEKSSYDQLPFRQMLTP
jgi:hypothetical protein